MAIAGRAIGENSDDDDDAVWAAKYVGFSGRRQRPVGWRPDETRTGRWKSVRRIVGDYSGITVVAHNNNNNIPAGREKRRGGDHTSPSTDCWPPWRLAVAVVGREQCAYRTRLAPRSRRCRALALPSRILSFRKFSPLLITKSPRFPSLSIVCVFVNLSLSVNDFFRFNSIPFCVPLSFFDVFLRFVRKPKMNILPKKR